jgi:hypothetical protein
VKSFPSIIMFVRKVPELYPGEQKRGHYQNWKAWHHHVCPKSSSTLSRYETKGTLSQLCHLMRLKEKSVY